MLLSPLNLSDSAADLASGSSHFAGQSVIGGARNRLLAEPAAEVTNPALDILAIVGVSIWAVALLVLVVGDLSRAAHHMHRHPPGPGSSPRQEDRRPGAWR